VYCHVKVNKCGLPASIGERLGDTRAATQWFVFKQGAILDFRLHSGPAHGS
jgi:hypothetical protein